jgi:hypothetical protein
MPHDEGKDIIMGIGTGIVLLLFGLILLMGVVNLDIPFVEDYQLGILLTVLGVVALILVVTLGGARRRSTHVVERDVTS